jgi:type III pantothenate kinase
VVAAIDIGNSQIKVGLFDKDKLHCAENVEPGNLLLFLRQHLVENVIISIVGDDDSLVSDLVQDFPKLLLLKPDTPVPINIDYKTPQTLGIDRVAAAVGAVSHFAGPLIVIDAGSCITCDLIDADHTFRGGTISPGLQMRLQAMHTFTAHLPLLKLDVPKVLVGQSTNECMISGAVNGARLELAGFIRQYLKDYPELKVIICGGDANYFDKMIELNIFVLPNLVLDGLNAILKFNE